EPLRTSSNLFERLRTSSSTSSVFRLQLIRPDSKRLRLQTGRIGMRLLKSTTLLTAIGIALWISSRDAATQSSTAQYGISALGDMGAAPTVPLAIDPGGFASAYGYGTTPSGDRRAFIASYYDHAVLQALGTLGGR